MKQFLTAILLSVACGLFWSSANAASFDQSANQFLLAQVDGNNRDLRDRIDSSQSDSDRRVDRDRRTDQNSSYYASRTTKGIGKEGLTECLGEFAYCGASTCKPTGRKIKVKEDGGKTTKEYEEAVCTCPIMTKKIAFQNGVVLHGVAAVNEGNMNGSCKPPSKGTIWSYAELDLKIWPQESADWESKAPIAQQCPAGGKTVNCWDFLCTIDPKPAAKGVRTATCRCPINEGVLGHQAGGNEIYATAAGGYFPDPSRACSMYPVSGAIPQPNQ